jgi:asparagine synthase (glutamine-hydrolysing)
MCGILGVFGLQPDSDWAEEEIVNLVRRGPDHHAVVRINQKTVIGAARLAMTDPLPRSNQPFVREDLNAAISFNGEIYNYRELRSKLETSGYKFFTDSDTEVLLVACHKFGREVTTYLNGMYSFAYVDSNLNNVMLARDSLGKKPLYWSKRNNLFYWSSSLKLVSRGVKNTELSRDALATYLAFGYTIDPITIYKDIFALTPGSILQLELTLQGELDIKLNQATPYEPERDLELQSLGTEISSAVRHRIEGHPSVAISLSGGLDSTIIAMLASKSESKITGYSAIWSDSDKSRYNLDAEFAEQIARNIGIDFAKVEMPSSSEIPHVIDQFVLAMEEPNSNPTGISMMNLYSEIAADSHRLVLTGDGADEIFAGYPRYEKSLNFPHFLNLSGQWVDQILSSGPNPIVNRLKQLTLSQTNKENNHRWAYWHWNFQPSQLSKILLPKQMQSSYWTEISKLISLHNPSESQSAIESMLFLDRAIWLSMESNRKLDRISMNKSIEARSPFEDERVIAKGLLEMRSNRFTNLNKKILWEAFPNVGEIGVRKDKTGFISPIGHWLRNNPNLVKESLNSLSMSGYFNKKALTQYLNAPSSGDYRRMMQLWSLVVLSRWLVLNEEK